MNGENDSTDFLEDLSNLSNDLKHPKKKTTEINDINVDDLLADPLDDPIINTEFESLPVIKKESEELPAVVEQQESAELAVQSAQPSVPDTNNPEEIQDFVLKQCQDLIKQGKETLEQLQDTVINTCDGKAINGYATLVASLGKVLDTANSIGMEKSRIKSSIEMENLKHKHKTQIKSSEPQNVTNNALIVAGREEIMKMLNKASQLN